MLAHPFLEAVELPVSPLVAALAASAIVIALGYRWPASTRAGSTLTAPMSSWEGSLRPGQVVARAGSVALAVLAVVAGRVGPDSELRNLAPALLVGAGWPLLVGVSAVAGPVWRWLDPWDATARLLARDAPASGSERVHLAALPAAAWAWYLVALPESLRPATVALTFGAYSIATIVGALALGRRRWLGQYEPFGIVLAWIARLPRRGLTGWSPPPGAEVVLGTLLGGLTFGLFRGSSLAPDALSGSGWATAMVGLAAVAGAAGVVLAQRGATRRGAPGSVVAAAIPAVAGVALALALARNRLLTSVQLLPVLASDPFGRGWDLFGTADWGVNPDPLGVAGRAAVQAAILLAGHVAGVVVVATRVSEVRSRDAAIAVLAVSAAVATASIAAV
jgi:hypothetical protein